jgi:hypothetical protein
MSANGHWFCERCDDVVTLRAPAGRWDSITNVLCPVCHHDTAFFVKDVAPFEYHGVSPQRAAYLFAKLRSEFNPGDEI